MDFYPLEQEELDTLQATCWEAQEAVGQQIADLLGSMAATMAELDAAQEQAIIALNRRLRSAITRGCKPLEAAINGVMGSFIDSLNTALAGIDTQIAVLQGSLQEQQAPGAVSPSGGWWFDAADPYTGNPTFVPGSPKPPPGPGDWHGPYGSQGAAQAGWSQRQPPAGTLSPLPPSVPRPPPPMIPPAAGPVSVPMQPPQPPPPTRPAPPPLPPPPAPVVPSPAPLPAPAACPAPIVQCPQPAPVTVLVQASGGQATANAAGSPITILGPDGRPLPPSQPAAASAPTCGIDPSRIASVLGYARVPVAWTDTEMADIDSECGQIMCESVRGQIVPVSLALAAIRAGDASAAFGPVSYLPPPPIAFLPDPDLR